MSLTFNTNDPSYLLGVFRKMIADNHVQTWSYDGDGDFTHTPEQWKNKAWLRPQILPGRLQLHILNPRLIAVSKEVYAVYHGRFLEAMLAHCDHLFLDSYATALPANGDRVAA